MSSEVAAPILSTDDVKVHFGGVKAVDGISIVLRPGLLYAVVGPNGSGKTTLINAISRFAPITSGRIEFDGGDLGRLAPHQIGRVGIARTFQSIRLLPTLTARENVMLALESRPGMGSARAQRQRTAAALGRLGLHDVADDYPENLPYGTQRRIEIARAIVTTPKLLLLDEPLAGMNRQERAEIAAIMTDLRDSGLPLLLVEHDLRTVLSVSDYMFVMNFGRLIAAGEPHETASLAEVREAYLGRGGESDAT